MRFYIKFFNKFIKLFVDITLFIRVKLDFSESIIEKGADGCSANEFSIR